MKLSKLKNLFKKTDLVKGDDTELFAALDQAIVAMFPDAAATKEKLGNMTYKSLLTITSFEVDKRDLMFHLNDRDWLVNFVRRFAKQQAINLNWNQTETYVDTSRIFENCRKQYAQDLVKAQIELNLTGRQMTVLNRKSPLSILGDRNYDKAMRGEFVYAMEQLGMDDDMIERGVEAHADLWRKRVMEQTFFNRYLKLSVKQRAMLAQKGDTEWKHLMDMEKEYHDIWLRLREYEYYQAHQKVIDELGTDTASMHMPMNEVTELLRKAKDFQNRYNAYLGGLMGDAQNATSQESGSLWNMVENIEFFMALDRQNPDREAIQKTLGNTGRTQDDQQM